MALEFLPTALAALISILGWRDDRSVHLNAVCQRALHNLNYCEQWLTGHTDVVGWDYLESPAAYRRNGLQSLALFSADFATHPDRYLPAALPKIPLGDNAVDVVLCANFLFAYADTFDVDFHVAAIVEKVRVARSEVLIHPLAHATARTSATSPQPSPAD